MIPPRGFASQKYPLEHKFSYMFGLSAVTETSNSTMCVLLRNVKNVASQSSIEVNRHNTNLNIETGSVCAPMSIIDKLQLELKFSFTNDADINNIKALQFYWMPIFFSFKEKLDAKDDATTTTVEAILSLIQDTTEEDITPLYGNTKLDVGGPASTSVPLSTVHLTESALTHLNMDTSDTQEHVAWDDVLFSKAIQRYTNRGALKACVGKRRYITLTSDRPNRRIFINKFVPKSIRRIMPYSNFIILVHLPINSTNQQFFTPKAGAGSLSELGVVINCQYHEWNSDHYQDMSGTGT